MTQRTIKFRAWDGKEMSKPFTMFDLDGDYNGDVLISNVMSYPCLYFAEINELLEVYPDVVTDPAPI